MQFAIPDQRGMSIASFCWSDGMRTLYFKQTLDIKLLEKHQWDKRN
jgi:hypothetical protein